MKWTELTPHALTKAALECGLAVLPLGSLEAHAGHLPLGNDTFKVERTCIAAAEEESAVVLPPLFYTDTASMRSTAGAISIRMEVLLELTLNICDEVARNGFSKILLVSGHGGNSVWLSALRSHLLDQPRPYLVYTYYVQLLGGEKNKSLMESAIDGHGGEVETSVALHLFPEMIDLNGRLSAVTPDTVPDIGGAETPYDWAIRWPKAICGDPFPATGEKGRVFFESNVQQLANCIGKVKADTDIARFKDTFERLRRSIK